MKLSAASMSLKEIAERIVMLEEVLELLTELDITIDLASKREAKLILRIQTLIETLNDG